MNTLIEETTALILAGEGYQLTIAPEAEARKTALIHAAGSVTLVTNNDESADAQVVSRRLAGMRIEVEKCRKQVKEPVNRIGKLIDQTAKDFIEDLEKEEKRIGKLVGDHAIEVARAKAEKEREERRAFEEARAAREAAERATAEAEEARENKASIAEVIAARKAAEAAEKERQEALAARMESSAEVAGTKVAQGVRFAIDFEVISAEQTLREQPNLVDLTVRRSDTLAYLKAMEAEGINIEALGAEIGLRVFKKPVVSSR